MVQRTSSELEQNYGMSYRKNREVAVVPVVDLTAYQKIICGEYNTCDPGIYSWHTIMGIYSWYTIMGIVGYTRMGIEGYTRMGIQEYTRMGIPGYIL